MVDVHVSDKGLLGTEKFEIFKNIRKVNIYNQNGKMCAEIMSDSYTREKMIFFHVLATTKPHDDELIVII
ncbi:hypothetical protein [Methanococcus maripaludis]|jgi:hypothetical protein|uniref:Uncharacterized protein n=1 Tax=Methanococcus maripaludis TaxID=39152 RepID=A0A7J9PDT3_METMI|nr:hypothetical protein [Methanococcus maripaludis]MBA2853001.1 hypothetical protein [Methanococcus maripaludis]MBA2860948.1 hypothetical protein [Methanococcus maripaludis]